MIFLGLFFGILVSAYLPGYLAVRRSELTIPLLSKTILSVLLSLMLIFQVSFVATGTGLLWIYWAYFFGVLALTAFQLRKVTLSSTLASLKTCWNEFYTSPFGLLLFLILLIYIASNFERYNGVFSQWDAIVSWNRWATDWFHGEFPHNPYHYPQLLPAAWAAIYRFASHDYQYFVVFLTPTCVFLYLYTIAEMGNTSRGLSIVNFGMIYFWLIHLFNIYLFDGYVDLMVIVSTGTCLLFLKRAQDALDQGVFGDAKKFGLFAILIACAASLAKQGGLLMLGFCLLETFLMQERLPKKDRYYRWAIMSAVVLVLPWYLYVQYRIVVGKEASEVAYVTGEIYQGKSPFQRLIDSTLSMRVTSYLFLANAIWFFVFKGWKRRLAAFTFILYVIWGCFFCYDYRNLATGYATCAFTYGMLFGDFFMSTLTRLRLFFENKKVSSYSVLWIFVPILVVLFLANRNNPVERLEFHSRKLKIRAYANPLMENFLYHEGWSAKCGSLVSNWELASYMPDFEKRYQWINLRDDTAGNREELAKKFSQSGFHCFILPMRMSASLEGILQESLKKRELKAVFQSEEYRFFESGSVEGRGNAI